MDAGEELRSLRVQVTAERGNFSEAVGFDFDETDAVGLRDGLADRRASEATPEAQRIVVQTTSSSSPKVK